MPRKNKRERAVEQLLSRVYEAEEDPRAMADSLGLSLRELAAWADRPGNAAVLGGLRRLGDTQTQLILSRYRRTAAAKLLALANQEDDAELARKACVDLLKLELIPADAAPREGDEPDEPIDEASVIGALEAIGRE